MRNWSFMAFSAAACIVLFACTTSSNNTVLPPAPSNPAPVVAANNVAVNDAGDTQGTPKHWDIQTIQSQRIGPPGSTYTQLVVSVAFELNFPSDGTPDNTAFANLVPAGTKCVGTLIRVLCGQIEIDTDGNAATGVTPVFCGANGTYAGIDFTVDVGTLNPLGTDGKAPIFSNATGFLGAQVGEASISGGGNVVNITIPISAIGGSSSGPFNIGSVWGNNDGQTDCAPNAGYMADSVGRVPLSVAVPGLPGTGWTHP